VNKTRWWWAVASPGSDRRRSNLADQGFGGRASGEDKDLGGMARRIQTTLEGLDVQALLADLIGRSIATPRPRLHDATITEVGGYVGNFTTTVKSEGRSRRSTTAPSVLATGAAEHTPTEYLYGEDPRVLTQLELEERMARDEQRRRSGARRRPEPGHDPVRRCRQPIATTAPASAAARRSRTP